MNMLVKASAIGAAAATSPAMADAASTLDQKPASAIVQRAESLIQALRTRHVCDGWHIDEAGAEQMLRYLRALAANQWLDDADGLEATCRFLDSHGQSYDWVIAGDSSSMVCAAAARSFRAASVADPIFAAIENHKAALEAYEAVLKLKSEHDRLAFDKGCKPGRRFVGQERRTGRAEEEAAYALASTAPKTAGGLTALIDYLRTSEFLAGWLSNEDFRNTALTSMYQAAGALHGFPQSNEVV